MNVQYHVRDAQTRNGTSIKSPEASKQKMHGDEEYEPGDIETLGGHKMKFIHFITHKTYVPSGDNQLIYIVYLSLKLPCIK